MPSGADAQPVRLRVAGAWACFTRPDAKVDRVSYPVPTPAALRGVVEAVFWTPGVRYEVRRIGILRRGHPVAGIRREWHGRVTARGGPTRPEWRRTQWLADVAYLVDVAVCTAPWAERPAKAYRRALLQAARRGSWHHAPYLGCRECAATVTEGAADERPIPWSEDLGTLFFDWAYAPAEPSGPVWVVRHGPEGPRARSAAPVPLFFPARVVDGWIEVPPALYARRAALEADA